MKTTNVQMMVGMNAISPIPLAPASSAAVRANKLPIWLKVAFTGFMAVLVPVYWKMYGPTNFLYFCDVSLFLTLIAIWSERALPASMAAVGILIPQILWCVDFAAHFAGHSPIGMTVYMFDSSRPLFLRGLSFFHGWLPFLLVFIVARLGYDKRALKSWSVLAWALMLIAYFFLPPAGATLPNPQTPVNINYVYGLNDATPQMMMPPWAWLTLLLVALPTVIYLPTHLALKRLCKPAVVR